MPLEDLLPPHEALGHPGARANLVMHYLDGSYQTDCYCPTCEVPFTRASTPAEIKEFERIQKIPLTTLIY